MKSIFYLVSKGDYVNKKMTFCYDTFNDLILNYLLLRIRIKVQFEFELIQFEPDSIRKLNDSIRFEFDSNQFELH